MGLHDVKKIGKCRCEIFRKKLETNRALDSVFNGFDKHLIVKRLFDYMSNHSPYFYMIEVLKLFSMMMAILNSKG
ncbi:hypothetical protein BpHYR1_030017 [Brachionus plicatilis]|uniref:Uncharacterized protein n=1 Tax=Brachionus plicatilis TaxID=10195 RepID=A0A3M7QU22_BRAPC|nr:hypothetical protein BpHYR1_030017 [Brachionus plicatilis]